MKKRILAMLLAAVMVMALVPTVFAGGMGDLTNGYTFTYTSNDDPEVGMMSQDLYVTEAGVYAFTVSPAIPEGQSAGLYELDYANMSMTKLYGRADDSSNTFYYELEPEKVYSWELSGSDTARDYTISVKRVDQMPEFQDSGAWPVEGGNIYYEVLFGETIEIVGVDKTVVRADIPSSITGLPVSSVSIPNLDFENISLTQISIPYSVSLIFLRDFQKLEEIIVSDDNSFYSSVDGVLFDKEKTELIQFPQGKGQTYTIPTGTISIGSGAFEGCGLLTGVTIPASVTSIGDMAFYGCESLTGVTIPDSVTSIGGLAFYGCESLTSVTIPASVTSIGDSAFLDCTELRSIQVDTANQNFTSVDGVLFSKDMKTLYRYPIGKSAKEYQIPNGVTGIGFGAFAECNSLTGVTIPDGVTSIGDDAFWECESLTDVTIPDSVTKIGSSAFSSTGLTNVVIPDSVTSIGDWAFYGCDALKDVYYGGSREQWGKIVCNYYDFDEDLDKQASFADGGQEMAGLERVTIHYNSGAADPGPGPVDPGPETGFTDVKPGAYYADAVAWAVENGVTDGKSPTTFDPNGNCTRAQIVTFLWRAYNKPEPKSTVSPFTDVTDPSAYYYKAVLWAVENGVTDGKSPTVFDPNGTCTRGQAVTFLWRAADKPSASGGSAFTDVTDSNAYYYDAVRWAVENGVTDGKSPTVFDPNGTCTRGQIVTFLFRDLAG